jgi:hypothetical protein
MLDLLQWICNGFAKDLQSSKIGNLAAAQWKWFQHFFMNFTALHCTALHCTALHSALL